MRRRKFLRHLAVTPLIAAGLPTVQGTGGAPTTIGTSRASEITTANTLPPWAGACAEAWANASKAILFTDMSQCLPASAFSPRMKKQHWKVIPYELQGGPSGKLISASPQTGAPVVKLPL